MFGGLPTVTTVTVPSVWIPAERRSGRYVLDPLKSNNIKYNIHGHAGYNIKQHRASALYFTVDVS